MAEKSSNYQILWDKEDCKKILEWWEDLDNNRGDRARLRRCENSAQVCIQPAFMKLICQHPVLKRYGIMDLAAVVGVLSHVRDHDETKSFASQLGKIKNGKPVMSELRFFQIQKSELPQDFYKRMRRAVKLVGGRANVLSLADYILQWGKESRGFQSKFEINRLKFRMASEYYSEASKAK